MSFNIREFEVGDLVIFKPYEKAIKAKVTGIKRGYFGNGTCVNGDDNRIYYELSGVDEPLKSVCTGLCIVESKFFNFINCLHESAMESLTGEWQRPSEFTERGEVVRDLLEYGYIQCKPVVKDHKTGATVNYYR